MTHNFKLQLSQQKKVKLCITITVLYSFPLIIFKLTILLLSYQFCKILRNENCTFGKLCTILTFVLGYDVVTVIIHTIEHKSLNFVCRLSLEESINNRHDYKQDILLTVNMSKLFGYAMFISLS